MKILHVSPHFYTQRHLWERDRYGELVLPMGIPSIGQTNVNYQLRNVRYRAKMTREQVAKRMGVDKSVIHRLEMSDSSPTLESVVRYAAVCGHRMRIEFHVAVPDELISWRDPIQVIGKRPKECEWDIKWPPVCIRGWRRAYGPGSLMEVLS